MSAPLNNDNPAIPLIEEARIGIETLAMYHYQSMLDAGFDENYAKQNTALLLENQHTKFLSDAGLNSKSIGTVSSRITKLLKSVESLAKSNTEARLIYNELLSIEKQLQNGRSR